VPLFKLLNPLTTAILYSLHWLKFSEWIKCKIFCILTTQPCQPYLCSSPSWQSLHLLFLPLLDHLCHRVVMVAHSGHLSHNLATTQQLHNHNTSAPQPQHNSSITTTQSCCVVVVKLLCCGCEVVVLWLNCVRGGRSVPP